MLRCCFEGFFGPFYYVKVSYVKRVWELDAMILVDPFQRGIFCGSLKVRSRRERLG